MTDFPEQDEADDGFNADDVEQGVLNALEEHGYLKATSEVVSRDLNAVATTIWPSIKGAIAAKMGDRKKVIFTRGSGVAVAFPGTPGPHNEWAGATNLAYAKAVYKKLDTLVWGLLVTAREGKIQQKAIAMGYVLVRTKLAPEVEGVQQNDAVDGVYLTRDKACYWQDTYGRIMAAHKSKVTTTAKELSVFMEVVPEHAEDVNDAFKRDTQKALEQGEQLMLPALEAAAMADDADDDDLMQDEAA